MLTIQEYFDTLRGKSIAVIGMGVSNTAPDPHDAAGGAGRSLYATKPAGENS